MPRQIDHEHRRQQIAEATWTAVAELGVDGTSMRAIAERAGCTTGRLSHYFDSREDVLLGALRRAHLQASQRMLDVMHGHSGREALRAVLHEALPLDEQRRTEWKVWITFWAEAIGTQSLRREHERRYAEWTDLVRTLVGAADRTLGRATVRQVSDALVAVVDGIGIQTSLSDDRSAARRARATVDAALDRMLPPP